MSMSSGCFLVLPATFFLCVCCRQPICGGGKERKSVLEREKWT